MDLDPALAGTPSQSAAAVASASSEEKEAALQDRLKEVVGQLAEEAAGSADAAKAQQNADAKIVQLRREVVAAGEALAASQAAAAAASASNGEKAAALTWVCTDTSSVSSEKKCAYRSTCAQIQFCNTLGLFSVLKTRMLLHPRVRDNAVYNCP